MSTLLRRFTRLLVVTIGVAFLYAGVGAGGASAVCLGDCDNGGSVNADELMKIIVIILSCDSNTSGCDAAPGGCVNADEDADGKIQAGELTHVIANLINFPADGCPAGNTPTATNTVVVTATNTPLPTRTDTPLPTRTD